MLLEADQAQLVLLDYQVQLMPTMWESHWVLANALRLGEVARLLGMPCWGTEQHPALLGPQLPQVRALCGRTLTKMQFSAVEEGLAEWLRPPTKPQVGNVRSLPKHLQKPASPTRPMVVIAGCEAHVGVLQTALDLLEDEFEVWVVTDACSSRTERNRDAAFDRLAGAGAELLTTEMLAFECLRSAEHPDFAAVQAVIK
ncbi:MAG: isochorismatase family protein [Rhodoferax sp.]|nr:isochorismatase family protein [Rhodoferax sp.]